MSYAAVAIGVTGLISADQAADAQSDAAMAGASASDYATNQQMNLSDYQMSLHDPMYQVGQDVMPQYYRMLGITPTLSARDQQAMAEYERRFADYQQKHSGSTNTMISTVPTWQEFIDQNPDSRIGQAEYNKYYQPGRQTIEYGQPQGGMMSLEQMQELQALTEGLPGYEEGMYDVDAAFAESLEAMGGYTDEEKRMLIQAYNRKKMVDGWDDTPYEYEMTPLGQSMTRDFNKSHAKAAAARGISGMGSTAMGKAEGQANIAGQDYMIQYNQIMDALKGASGATASMGTGIQMAGNALAANASNQINALSAAGQADAAFWAGIPNAVQAGVQSYQQNNQPQQQTTQQQTTQQPNDNFTVDIW